MDIRQLYRCDLPIVGRLRAEEGGHGGQAEAPPAQECAPQPAVRAPRIPRLQTFLAV